MVSAQLAFNFPVFLLTVSLLVPCSAGVWFVDSEAPSGGDGRSWQTAFRTIEQGVNAAADGDSITVGCGTCPENLKIQQKSIVIRSTDPSDPGTVKATVIQAGQGTGEAVWTYGSKERTVVFDGLTILGTPSSGGAYFTTSAAIKPCVIIHNTSPDGGGISFSCGGGSLTVVGCRISHNSTWSSGRGRGIFVYGAASAEIRDNIISENAAFYGGGIYCSSSPSVIENNIISGNTAAYGAAIYSASQGVEVSNCTIVGNNGTAVYGPITISNCILWGNTRDLRQATASYCCIQNRLGAR